MTCMRAKHLAKFWGKRAPEKFAKLESSAGSKNTYSRSNSARAPGQWCCGPAHRRWSRAPRRARSGGSLARRSAGRMGRIKRNNDPERSLTSNGESVRGQSICFVLEKIRTVWWKQITSMGLIGFERDSGCDYFRIQNMLHYISLKKNSSEWNIGVWSWEWKGLENRCVKLSLGRGPGSEIWRGGDRGQAVALLPAVLRCRHQTNRFRELKRLKQSENCVIEMILSNDIASVITKRYRLALLYVWLYALLVVVLPNVVTSRCCLALLPIVIVSVIISFICLFVLGITYSLKFHPA